MATNDRPERPEQKIYQRLEQAQATGKAFDEEKERKVLGLPPPVGRDFIRLPESDARRRLVTQEDAEGARELAQLREEAKRTAPDEMASRLAVLEAQNAELRRQVAEATGVDELPRTPEPVTPGAIREPLVLPDGAPNDSWTARQLIQFYKDSGFGPALVRGGMGMSKAALLNECLRGLSEAAAKTGDEGAAA